MPVSSRRSGSTSGVKALVLGGAAAVYGVGHPVAAVVLAVVLVMNAGYAGDFRHRVPARD
ncbi:hypothetical protein [Streptomyces microflavus]|uniref:hypothetical protein n=1 Tax=Streptomyces microflavus TaxID=1919 RepID=UPI0033C5BB0C